MCTDVVFQLAAQEIPDVVIELLVVPVAPTMPESKYQIMDQRGAS